MIDRRRVQQSFGRQAHLYENHAHVQRRVVERLGNLVKTLKVHPENCLDVGAGSGMLLQSVGEMYRHILRVGVDLSPDMTRVARKKLGEAPDLQMAAGDAEYLPFASATFDLVLSTSTFQWLEKLEPAFQEVNRVLKPGGTFAFSLFGDGTLRELRSSYRSAAHAAGRKDDHTHTFFTVPEVSAALAKTGFIACMVTSEDDVELHPDVAGLLRSLKLIGAVNASPLKKRGLVGRSVMQGMMARYHAAFGTAAGIPATYEVIYGWGWKP